MMHAGRGHNILLVDDEEMFLSSLFDGLRRRFPDFTFRTANNGEMALAQLGRQPADLVITDLKMPRISGLQLLEKIGQENISVLTILMTGFGTVETAIEAMKRGAYDYLLKPFKVEEVIQTVLFQCRTLSFFTGHQ